MLGALHSHQEGEGAKGQCARSELSRLLSSSQRLSFGEAKAPASALLTASPALCRRGSPILRFPRWDTGL